VVDISLFEDCNRGFTREAHLGDVVMLRHVFQLFVELGDSLLVGLERLLGRLVEELCGERGQSLLPGKGCPLEGSSSLTRLRWTSSNRRSASVLYGLAVEPDAEADDATSRSEPDPLAAAAVSSSRSFCDVLDLLFFFFFLLRAVGSVVSDSVEVRQRLCDEVDRRRLTSLLHRP
jgi:hypothetical protein